MGLKLLREINESLDYVIEATGVEGKKNHYLTGVFMEGGIVNRNNRLYAEDVLRPEVERFNREIVKENRAFGELGHPSGPQINLDRVAIIIKEIAEKDHQYRGKALVTETPMGCIVKGLLEGGAKLGVSSRALGSLKEGKNGEMLVQNDLKIITVDVVADPSAPNAFVEGIMENVDWVQDATGEWKVMEAVVMEAVENTKKKIKRMNIRQINEQKVHLFEEFLTSLTIR